VRRRNAERQLNVIEKQSKEAAAAPHCAGVGAAGKQLATKCLELLAGIDLSADSRGIRAQKRVCEDNS